MTKEEILTELQKLSEEKIKILKKERLLKQQLLTHAKFFVGQRVKSLGVECEVEHVFVSNKGHFRYTLAELLKGGHKRLWGDMKEKHIEPI